MTSEVIVEIDQIRKDMAQCDEIQKNLILQGHSWDSPVVKLLDDRIWHLMFRHFVLTAGEVAGAKLLSDLGIHQN